jgi:thiol-disulfide isomerase/thioredoxin
MNEKRLFLVFFLSLLLLARLTYGQSKPVGFAAPFPDLKFQQILSKEDRRYLGIPKKAPFSFKEIRGSLILVEFISTYCVICEARAPIFNEVYSSIEKDPGLKGKVTAIVPINLTKVGNLHWTGKDLQKLRSRVVGRSILEPFDFDPSVDSVSRATVTALLIFDCLDKVSDIYKKLKQEGYIKK